MTLEKRNGSAEIVWADDGLSVKGAAAHYHWFTDDGEYVRTTVEPLTGSDDPVISQLAAACSADIIAERDNLLTQIAAIGNERDAAVNERDSLNSKITELQNQLDAILNPPGPDTSTKEGAEQYISNERYKVETGGIRIGEQSITTERDEIGHWFPRFYNAMMWLQGDPYTRAGNPDGLYPYKPKNGMPTVLSAEQVIRAYECVAWYVNACFATEAELYKLLESGTAIDTVLAMIPGAWPQTQFEWVAPT